MTNLPAIPPDVFNVERVRRSKSSRFNPIRNLQPERLSQYLDNFEYGDLRYAAWLWEIMERRDDTIKTVAMKRKKDAAQRPFEILTVDDSAEAQAHKKTLEYFYNNLTATHALDRDQRGGCHLLFKQMMDAVSKKYAVHHLVFKPTSEGMTAEFWFVPLWFFENRTGKLRFLQTEANVEGIDMNEDEWLVTVGDCLMEPSSISYMFKHLPLKDWLVYCERNGMPGFVGKTSAAKGSDQ